MLIVTNVTVSAINIHDFCLIKFNIMNVEQIYTGCLAQGAYYITSNGEAAIIDPLREVAPYLGRLSKDGVKLKYINVFF